MFCTVNEERAVLCWRDEWISTGCAEKLHETSHLRQRLLKACLRPYYAGHYLSLETVPAIA
jgi:hypothetical protein